MEDDVSETGAVVLGIELDNDHVPETNGRMAVCRRCGARTDSPAGLHHVVNERQLSRSQDWLRQQDRRRYILRAKDQVR
jgi:hypothetical protein